MTIYYYKNDKQVKKHFRSEARLKKFIAKKNITEFMMNDYKVMILNQERED